MTEQVNTNELSNEVSNEVSNELSNEDVNTKENNGVEQIIQSLLDDSNNLQNQYKSWNMTLKKLLKEINKEQKEIIKSKPKRKVNQKPQLVTKPMATFMTKNASHLAASESYNRQDMMRAISAYIKTKNLQDPDNKKQWKRDKTLTKLLNLDKDHYTFMEINGLISRVVVKK